MMRRVVCLLLMPMVMLTQWASVGHCHWGESAPAHARTPHVHLGGIVARQSGHQHGEHGHHHHHHDTDNTPEPGDVCVPCEHPEPQHDDDAVYIPVTPGTTALPQVEVAKLVAQVDVLPTTFLALSPPPATPSKQTHAPQGLHPGACPLYVQILTLLI